MPPADENGQTPESSDHTGGDDLSFKEQELLAKARDVARRITARVHKALEDTDARRSLPAEEKPPLASGACAADSGPLPAGIVLETVGVPPSV
jgi:hypothetical protein